MAAIVPHGLDRGSRPTRPAASPRHTARSGPAGAPAERKTVKKSYSQMLDEIEQLKKRAEEVRRKEVDLVIARIKDLIAFYGLTEEDLGFRKKVVEKAATPPPPPPAAAKKKRKSRYTERPLAGPPVKR
jgi:DNA-binding protein H-NS